MYTIFENQVEDCQKAVTFPMPCSSCRKLVFAGEIHPVKNGRGNKQGRKWLFKIWNGLYLAH